MFAPLSAGATALLVCSAAFLKRCAAEIQRRSVKVPGIGMSGGMYRKLDDDGRTAIAGRRAYEQAGVGPMNIDVAEVHEAMVFS